MQFVTVNGLALNVELKAGAQPGAPALVFANSLGTDFRIWDGVIATLGGRFTTLRYDKRGHGLSDIGETPYAMEDHVSDLAVLMDHFGIENAVIVGLSVGGMIAQGLALTRPDLVRALVLSNTAHKIGNEKGWSERIERVEKEGIAALAEAIMTLWFTPSFRSEDNPFFRGCRNMLVRSPVAGYAATCVALSKADYTADVPKLSVPTLCIVGDQDGSTPPDLVRSLADLIPGARFVVIEGAGHIPCVERPASYAGHLETFLASIDA